MNIGFAYRIAFLLALVLLGGTALTSVLGLNKFENVMATLLTSRFEFVANDLRNKIQTQMDFGLLLNNIENVNEQMEQLTLDDEQIISIEVFDETGSVLFSTDPSFIGDLVSEEWVFLWEVSGGKASWSVLENDAVVVGVGLRNNLDQDVGSVALRYSRVFLDQSVTEQIRSLLLYGLIVAACVILLSFFGCAILLRGSFRDWRNMREALRDIMDRNRDTESIREASGRHPEFAMFARSSLDAMDELDTATRKISQLDED